MTCCDCKYWIEDGSRCTLRRFIRNGKSQACRFSYPRPLVVAVVSKQKPIPAYLL